MTALEPPPQEPYSIGAPLLGALMRIPVDISRTRMLDTLHASGYQDLVAAHLVILRYPGPHLRRPGEIAAGSGLSKQAANYLLGQLERLGYLERRDDPDDRRGRRVYLTDRGHAALTAMRAVVAQLEREWTALIGADDIEQLRELLLRLDRAIAPDVLTGH
jgi:DNA-binding MarR family transcriptional regulator